MIIMVAVLVIKSIADMEGMTVLITSVALYFKKICKVFSVMSTNPASKYGKSRYFSKNNVYLL